MVVLSFPSNAVWGIAMSGPLPGVERPKRPPPPKVRPQRPPPPALATFHSVDGSTRPKVAAQVSPNRHSSASAQFSRVEQGNPLFSTIKDEDDVPEKTPVAQVKRITDPLGCRTWEEPATAAVKKGRSEEEGSVEGDEKENMDLYKQTAFVKEEDNMGTVARSSGLASSASLDSISSDSDELFQSVNNTLFPESESEQMDNPTVDDKLHHEATPADVELAEYPSTGSKLNGDAAAREVKLTEYPIVGRIEHSGSGREVDYSSMPLCEDYYASNPEPSCDFGESSPLEEIEEHPLHKEGTNIECSQPLAHGELQRAVPQPPVSAEPGLSSDQHSSQSGSVPLFSEVKGLSGAPGKRHSEGGRAGRKVKVPLKDVFSAMQKDLKAKDPHRADKEEMDEPLLSWPVMLSIALLNYFYLCFGFSSFLSGFITGIYVFFLLLAGGIGFLSYYEVMKRDLLDKLRMEAEKEEREQLGTFNGPKLNTVPPLKSELFTVAYSYDFSLRKTSVTHPIRISLNDLKLTIEVEAASVMGSDVSRRFWQFGEDRTIQERNAIMRELDMKSCRVYLAPDEVAKDRKRRWNKKYPICLHIRSGQDQECVLYLFVKVARDKEEWYRRMQNACNGITTAELAAEQARFYQYISKYVPKDTSHSSPLKEVGRRMTRRRSTQQVQLSQLSNREGNDEGTSVDAPASSARKQTTEMVAMGTTAENEGTHFRSTKGMGGTPAMPKSYQDRGMHDQAKGPLQSRSAVQSSKKPSNMSASHLVFGPDIASPELSLDWVNVLAARLCWDFWHEEKWRQLAMQKIDKKLRRLQRPSFLEELHVTDVQVGSDIPRIKRITSQPRWAGREVCGRRDGLVGMVCGEERCREKEVWLCAEREVVVHYPKHSTSLYYTLGPVL